MIHQSISTLLLLNSIFFRQRHSPRHLFVLQADSVLVTSSLLVKKNVDHAIIANGDFAIRNQVTGQDIKNSIENTGTDDVLPPSI